MRKHLLGWMLIAGLAACTSDTEPNSFASAPVADPSASPVPDTAAGAALPGRAAGSTSFASLPDRGELLAYGGARKSRQSGAYHYHPVALSEEHALNAIASGEMVLTTPDGETLRLGYENHEEHPDGNWTWIGRNADGSSAVLTFGEKAVFGLFTRGDEQFRVRTDRTGAWVVATDRTRLPPGDAHRDRSDVLLPPEHGALAAAGIRHLQKAAPSASNVTAAAAVVDVLLGYSTGLVQQLGSQSAAQTRMANLVAAANAAYANSGVNLRLRAVYALQVDYADTTTNEDALQQLTGYDAGAGRPITPNSAFNALREARDEYGADLVAFVRRYREPEQSGCGIAWLLGMNGSGIDASRDAEFGYAVISDGEDLDEGDGFSYFCSDFSLAHEFGHLMGQAHNQEDAAGRAGAHSYSYGYRETLPSGFFTIMAYPLGDGQLEIPHFANPSVRYQNRPTGSAGADNVRSMNQTMPIVAQFRDTVVPIRKVRRDVNGDGRSDLFWLGGTTRFAHWLMNAHAASFKSPSKNVTGYTYVGSGDLNGDGRTDIVWSGADGTWMWPSTGAAFGKAVKITNPLNGWRAIGVADINGDGLDDLLWHNTSTRRFAYWLMNGHVATYQSPSSDVSNYQLVAIGDFNGDGLDDLVWSNGSRIWLWRSGGNAGFTPLLIGSHPAGWAIRGAVDLDGDGRADLLWHQPAQRKFSYWLMNSNVATKKAASTNVTDYQLAAFGDFNGDGFGDLVWTNNTRVWMWIGAEEVDFTSKLVGSHPSGWTIR